MQTTTERRRNLEKNYQQTYLRMVSEALPSIPSTRRSNVPGQLVVLDALEYEVWRLRSVPGVGALRSAASDEAANKVRALVDEVVDSFTVDGQLLVSPASIARAARSARQQMQAQQLARKLLCHALEERSHAIVGSFFHHTIIEKMREAPDDNYYFVPNYIEQTQFACEDQKDAFRAIVGEILYATWELDIEFITTELVASASPLVVPFPAMCELRGVAVWFLFPGTDYHVTEPITSLPSTYGDTIGADNENLVRRLGDLSSIAAIEVFKEYFAGRLRELMVVSTEQLREIAIDALRVIYPCRAVRLMPEGATAEPTLAPTSNTVGYTFENPAVIEFLGAAAVEWDLIYPPRVKSFPGQSCAGYFKLLEVKLSELADIADRQAQAQYGQLVHVFGHHVGTLFKTSGILGVLASLNRGESLQEVDARSAIERLLPVWAISRAIRLLSKPTLLDLAVSHTRVLTPEFQDELAEAVLTLVRYVYDHSSDRPPFLTWAVSEGSWTWDDTPGSGRPGKLVSLPFVHDEPDLYDTSLALTMGLFELVANARSYPNLRTALGREAAKSLRALGDDERRVSVSCEVDDAAVVVRLTQPILLDGNGRPPRSRALDDIRRLESQLRRDLISTSQPRFVAYASVPGVAICESTWQLRWSLLAQRAIGATT